MKIDEIYSVILGSKSPRRTYLLSQMGIAHSIRTEDTDESYDPKMNPFDVASYLANKKSEAIQITEGEILITADSVVILDDEILGKPRDMEQAFEYIQRMSGRVHFVDTGVTLRTIKKTIHFHEVAEVKFSPIATTEIQMYLDAFKPLDKAGSYGIQDWIGLSKVIEIKGTYTNIMGLPTASLYSHLQRFID